MSNHSDFIASYCELYEQYFGTPYMVSGAKDGAAVKRLLATGVELEKVIAVLGSAFTQSGYPYDNACTIAGFVSVWPILAAREAKRHMMCPVVKQPLTRWELQQQINLIKQEIIWHPHNSDSVREDQSAVVDVPLQQWRDKLRELQRQYALLPT